MCGIVGYIGEKQASTILISGLKKLEYRGYDSSGIAILGKGLQVQKEVGRVQELENKIDDNCLGTVGIAHTRWATHGEPSEINAHPHTDQTGKIALVHNGIIENYAPLKSFLESKGIEFQSQTDSEVLVQLIGHIYSESKDIVNSVRSALKQIEGSFGIALVCADHPRMLIAAKRGSPLVVGIGDKEYIVASDGSAIIEHTSKVMYLSDNEIVTIHSYGHTVTENDDKPVNKEVNTLELTLEEFELGDHQNYMHKEIHEQPISITNATAGRIVPKTGEIVLNGLIELERQMAHFHRVILFGCGTAYHAGLVGKYLFEHLAIIPTRIEYSSELRYQNPIVEEKTLAIAISQSGETADTLAALHELKIKGATIFGVVNSVGSTIARETDAGVYLHAGQEIGVASTKAFTAQIAVLAMIAARMGRKRNLSHDRMFRIVKELAAIPEKVQKALDTESKMKEIAEIYGDRNNWLYLGRGVSYPVALEGALKIKEISYIHAEGMPAAEMKHGPIALIDEGMPVVFVAPKDHVYDKVVSNIEEVRGRGGKTIVIATEGDDFLPTIADHVICIPRTPFYLSPLITTIPLQLLAYHAALYRGHDVDKPRNLAKSVTVE